MKTTNGNIKRMKWRARTIGQWVDIYMEVDGGQHKTTLKLFRCSPRKLRQAIKCLIDCHRKD